MDKDLSAPESSHLPPDFGKGVGPQPLSMEQTQWLLKVLSTSDKNAIGEEMRKCTSEVIMTRGLPLAAVAIGSMYYARQRLPKQYHFGPKGWPFYALIGFGAVSLSTLMSANSCTTRVKPLLTQLYSKYSSAATTAGNNYDTLRMANRSRLGSVGDASSSSKASGTQYDLTQDGESHAKRATNVGVDYQHYRPLPDGDTSSQYGPYSSERRSSTANNWMGTVSGMGEEDASLMPGTPYNSPSSTTHEYAESSETSNKSGYGDSGFS